MLIANCLGAIRGLFLKYFQFLTRESCLSFPILGVVLLVVFSSNQCNNTPKERKNTSETEDSKLHNSEISTDRIVFYIENSGSIGPYLHSFDSELKTTLVELSELPYFQDIPKSYYFIDGEKIQFIGNNLSELENSLNQNNFSAPTTDLTKIFKTVLDSVPNQTTILLTDGLYDISSRRDSKRCYIDKPMERLNRELIKLRSIFSQKLRDVGFQTVLLKANSSYSGYYYYATKPGVCSVKIDQWRPYYYFMFGSDHFLNNSELESSLENLNHVTEKATFQYLQRDSLPYQVMYYNPSDKTRGSYSTCRGEKNCLDDIRRERNNIGFDFLFQVDLSKHLWHDWKDKSLYSVSNENFKISEIKEISDPNYSHQIKISSDSISIYDRNLEINIHFPSCNTPEWVRLSSSEDEVDIDGDNQTTWGLNYIIDEIQKTYCQNEQVLDKLNFKLLR